jgi:tetratricopeptide (TPR) repeat protein
MQCNDAFAAHFTKAQIHFRRGNYEAAKAWLTSSLKLLNDEQPAAQTASAAFEVHCHIARCCCELGLRKEAILAYEKGLKIGHDYHLEPQRIAATKASLGAVLLHSSYVPSDVDNAIDHFRDALAIYEHDAKEVASILTSLGQAYFLKVDYSHALAAYQKAYDIRQNAHDEDTREFAAAMCNLAQAHHLCSDLENAMTLYSKFLDLAESSNQYKADVSTISSCLADIHKQRHEPALAKHWYEKALSSARETFGDTNMEVVTVLFKLGHLQFQLEEYEESLASYNQGLTIQRALLPWNDPRILEALLNIARINSKVGNVVNAMASYCQIHSIQLATNGADSLEAAGTLLGMGLLQYEHKNYTSAYDLLLQALQIQQKHHGSNEHSDVAATVSSIGLVLFHQGAHVLASRCFCESLHICRTLFGADHRDNAFLCYNLATIALESGDEDLALEYYKESLRVELCGTRENQQGIILTLQHVAIVHQRRGELELALEYFHQALRYQRESNGQGDSSLGRLLTATGNLYHQTGAVGPMMEAYTEAARLALALGGSADTIGIATSKHYDLSKLHPPCAPIA